MRALAALLILAGCAGPGGGRGGCDGRLILRNESPLALEQFYARPEGTMDWGRDLMPAAGLPAGAERNLQAGQGRQGFRAVFASGRAAEIAAVDPCATPRMTLRERGITAEP